MCAQIDSWLGRCLWELVCVGCPHKDIDKKGTRRRQYQCKVARCTLRAWLLDHQEHNHLFIPI